MTINNPFTTRAIEPERPDWRDSALCAQVDPDLFFPEKGGRTGDAKRICRCCPVQAECLQDALSAGSDRYGIWGGQSERQRRDMRPVRRTGGKPIDRAEAVRLLLSGHADQADRAQVLHCSPGAVSNVLRRAAS